MEIQVKDLMDDNEMLSHIFLSCINKADLETIRNKFIGDVDWRKESVTIPVEMKIGGVEVNPKAFFDEWRNQMSSMIKKQVKKKLEAKLSGNILNLANKLTDMSVVVSEWETEINWEVENPLIKE